MKALLAAAALAASISAAQAAPPPTALFPSLTPGAAGIGPFIAGAAVGIIAIAIIEGIRHPAPKVHTTKGNPFLPGPNCKITPSHRMC